MDTPILTAPVPDRLPFYRRAVARLLGGWRACRYCGSFYVPCHSKEFNLFVPVPQNGLACPWGHEGYVDEFMGCGYIRKWFDHVQEFAS